jgi:K+-transporting ATPase ATPase A chain
LFIGLTSICALRFGTYIAEIFLNQTPKYVRHLTYFEQKIYSLCGIDPNVEQNWKEYALAIIKLTLIGFIFLLLVLLFQHYLPLNPRKFHGLQFDLAVNVAISYVTNTNWQAYNGEGALSYFSQMVGLTVQNFVSAAIGLSVCITLIRGITRKNATSIGNFYSDFIKSIIYILLPLSFISSLVFISQGVPQTLSNYANANMLEGGQQVIAYGPVASMMSIKELGSNGGGFFGINSAHPFENPNTMSNFLHMLLALLIPAAMPFAYGVMVNDKRQGYTIFAAVLIVFIVTLGCMYKEEAYISPKLEKYKLDSSLGNMEGKETRFGIGQSTLFSNIMTSTSVGSINTSYEGFRPISGMVPLINIMFGEVIFGGIGSGFSGILFYIILAVFLAGLMVGRTPEYMGKKIEVKEIELAMFTLSVLPFCSLVFTSISLLLPEPIKSLTNQGPRGLTEMLYTFLSTTTNNGSAFTGFICNTTYFNIILGIVMLIGRFSFIVPVLMMAESLASKKIIPVSSATFPTYGVQFVFILIGTIIILSSLAYFPVLTLGPILEQVSMLAGKSF